MKAQIKSEKEDLTRVSIQENLIWLALRILQLTPGANSGRYIVGLGSSNASSAKTNVGQLLMTEPQLIEEASAVIANKKESQRKMWDLLDAITAKNLAIVGERNFKEGRFADGRIYSTDLYSPIDTKSKGSNSFSTVVRVYGKVGSLEGFAILAGDQTSQPASDLEKQYKAYVASAPAASSSLTSASKNQDGSIQFDPAKVNIKIGRDEHGALLPLSQQNIKQINMPEGSIKSASNGQYGGIDFDPTNMNLQIKRDGRGVPLPLPQQNLEHINIQGLDPIIIHIVPMNAENLPIFLGEAPKDPAREPELAAG